MHASSAQSLALALGIGALVTLLCQRLRFPAILPLLAVGLLLGDSALGWVDADTLGNGLGAFITLAVSLLIFEGALHLDRRTLTRAPNAVLWLLTIGALVTWATAAIFARYVVGLGWDTSILLGALLIVTGPTVVQPILRRIPLRPNLHAALMSEGILIDPIGAVLAATTLEVVRARLQGQNAPPLELAWLYAEPALAGVLIGAVFGVLATLILRRLMREPSHDVSRLTLVGMGACAGAVGFAEMAAAEAGLVAAAVCGVVMANGRIAGADELRRFKEQISFFLIGALFILLAARFDMGNLEHVGWREALFVVLVVLVVRPLSVVAASLRTVLSWRERAFVAFLAPRGIVAASLASIAAITFTSLAQEGGSSPQLAARLAREATMLETLVFLVIVVTVLLAGLFSAPVATLLKVRAGVPTGLLIVGGGRFARELALEISKLGIDVRLIDTNAEALAAAAAWSLPTHLGDATDPGWLEETVPLTGVGWVIAATDNDAVDTVVARWAAGRFGRDRSYRWHDETPSDGDPGRPLPLHGRPLRHLLFQMDIDAAHIEAWTEPREDATPFAYVHNDRLTLVPDEWEQANAPEGATIVGLVFGQRPKPKKNGNGAIAGGNGPNP